MINMRKYPLFGFLVAGIFAVSACKTRSRTASREFAREASCQIFVQGFYDWYFDRLNIQAEQQTVGPGSYDVLNFRPEVLTPELQKMLRGDRDASAKNHDEIVGLDFDPFINAQDWSGKYWVNGVSVKDGVCRASVWGHDGDKKREIVIPELMQNGGKWIFTNFHYPGSMHPEDENLIAILMSLRRNRENSAKGKA
jgi:hypothetical protein